MPERLGKYEITEILGSGAMGVVYKGFDPHIRRTVAIKTIRKELLEHKEVATILARFKNEAQAAGRLAHPGIIPVYEYSEDASLAYIVMEYVEGHGLDEYFKRDTPIAPQDVLSIMGQLLEALDFAHERGIVHRDIKPSNLIVTVSGRLKVADFGIARIDATELTQIGMVMGTPGYVAPEQYVGVAVDRRADVFAAGVVFYQMLSGVKPFTGSTETICYKTCNEDPPPPSQVDPSRGLAHFDPIVARALAKKPDDRYPTAQVFREAILAANQAPVSPSVSEETIIYQVKPPVALVEGTASRPRTESGAGSPTGYPPEWDVSVLKAVEKELTRIVGPVARVMVKRAARRTRDLESLYQTLADEIANDRDRGKFLASRGRVSKSSTPSAESAPTTGSAARASAAASRVSSEIVEQATRQLAVFLGPIAKVIVKKAAAKAAGPRELYLSLAEHLGNEEEKRRFLGAAGVR